MVPAERIELPTF